MSWDQDYLVPSYLDLLLQLTGKSRIDFIKYLETDLHNRLGLEVESQEEVVLAEGMFDNVKGVKVTLTDGRVFIPKLVESFTENGNHGIDTYQYFLEDETPNVSHTNVDEVVVHTCDVVDISDGPCCDPSHDDIKPVSTIKPEYEEEMDEDPWCGGDHMGDFS